MMANEGKYDKNYVNFFIETEISLKQKNLIELKSIKI